MPLANGEVSQTFTVRRISDSGAGEDLASEGAMKAQGIPDHIIRQFKRKSLHPCDFDTGGGTQPADETVTLQDDFGNASATYMLKNCPWVFAQGKRTEQC